MELFKEKESLDVQYKDRGTKNTIGNDFRDGKIDFRTALFNLRFKGTEVEVQMVNNFQTLKELKKEGIVREIGFTIEDDGSFNFYGVLSEKGEKMIKITKSKDETNANPGGEQQILTGTNKPLERNVQNKEFLPSASTTRSENTELVENMIENGIIEGKKWYGNNWYKSNTYMITENGEGQYLVEKTIMTKYLK
jgi:hypothetical protein